MMALSMWQPWADLWLSDNKVHETRPRNFNYRGWLAVHAAKRRPDFPGDLPKELEDICNKTFGDRWRGGLSFGCIIGAVYVVHCEPTDSSSIPQLGTTDYYCGNFDPGRFQIMRTEYFHIEPAPAVGRQGLFRVPEDIHNKLINEVISRNLIGAKTYAELRS